MSEREVVPAFWRLPRVLDHVPEGKSTFLRNVAEDIAPPPFKCGPRIVAWRADHIAAYLRWLEAKHNGAVALGSTWRDMLPPTNDDVGSWRSLGEAAEAVVERTKP
jgi:predicted DNA-binding transcriptional regulator AlpA